MLEIAILSYVKENPSNALENGFGENGGAEKRVGNEIGEAEDSEPSWVLRHHDMTEEQVKELQKQIAVYAVICKQLVDMHKAFVARHDMAGMNTRNVYGDSMSFGGNKVSPRQRWTPSNMQLEVLERFYDEAKGNPGKHIVKEITKELSQHGQVTESNVCNWFQNRRARSEKKHLVPTQTNKDKKTT